MKCKKRIFTFLAAAILMWNLSGSVFSVYGSEIPSNVEQEEVLSVNASVAVKDSKEKLKIGEKAAFQVNLKNETEDKAVFKLYFCQIQDGLSDDQALWETYLHLPSSSMMVDGVNEENKIPVTASLISGESFECSLEICREWEQEKLMSYYAALELPAGAGTEFELSVLSEKAESVAIIPVMENSQIRYGKAARVTWEQEKDIQQEEIAESENEKEDQQENTDSTNLSSEIYKFRTSIPQKGGVLNLQYGFEEAQWTTVYPKKNGYATMDYLSGGEVVHVSFAADSGYEIGSCRILDGNGCEVGVLNDCVGQETYAHDVGILDRDVTLEVTFVPKRELTGEEAAYQESLENIYHRDPCVSVLGDIARYENKNLRAGTPEAVNLVVGDKISYPSQLYHTREFYISGCDGIVGIGYCMQPNKKNPSSGWYYDIIELEETRKDYANAYKLAMLTNYDMELQSLGDIWFKDLDQGEKIYREIYIHAVIGYLETGTLIGLTGAEQIKIINIANEIYEKANNGEVENVLKNYRIYAINGGISRYQDICFLIRNAKGGLSIQKKSGNPEITNENPNYSLEGAVYGIYSDYECTKEIMTMTTDKEGYAATGDEALDDGSYYVKEKVPSKGYLLDTTVYTYEIAGGGTASENKKTSSEPPKTGRIDILKVSALPGVTDGNDCYSLGGAEYTVYKNKECTEPVTKIVTDNQGKGTGDTIPLGDYYVKETKAPEGYEIDPGVYPVSLKEGKESVTISRVEVQDYPGYDGVGISLTKTGNGKENSLIPTLEGTQFTIKYYDGYYSKENLPGEAEKIWVIEVKKDKNTGKYVTILNDTYLLDSLSDDLYKNLNGETILPYGTITIQETKPASGYTLKGHLKDEKGNIVAVDSELFVTQVNKKSGTVKLEGGNEYTAQDMLIQGSIKIKKYDKDGKTPLLGAVFEIKNSEGKVVGTSKTDKNGEVLFEKLNPDTYTITEKKTGEGNTLLKEPLVVQVPTRVTEQQIKEQNIDEKQCIYDPIEDIYYIYNFVYEITNHANFQVPMTGGETTPWIFLPMAAGLAALTGAMWILMKKKEIRSF